jgi:predicted SAM-dependent methyltransferase
MKTFGILLSMERRYLRWGDKDYDSDEAAQIRHFNYQAMSIILSSLCREEYNKVEGLKSAKEIWDVLKTAHEGDEVTKITKQ